MKAFCSTVFVSFMGGKCYPAWRKPFLPILLLLVLFAPHGFAQQVSVSALQQFSVAASTGDKPQSKVWNYNGSWYCVMPNSSGTKLWKLNGTSWSAVMSLHSGTIIYADVKAVGNLVHVLMFDDLNDNAFIRTLEFNAGSQSYQSWSVNPNTTTVSFGAGGGRKTETATFDIDSQGKMWMCYERDGVVNVRWSNAPFTTWSSDIQIISGLVQRDIAAIIAFSDAQGSKIGVAWSNHNTQRFGFKYHLDTNSPTTWSNNEIPGGSQALNVGLGMADDHINLATTSDGHVYMAAKTSYDLNGYATLILLDRTPNQSWGYYEVEFNDKGTKPVVVANEAANKLLIAYTYPSNSAGDMVYKIASRDSLSNFANASRNIIINRDGSVVDMASATKDIWSDELVVMGYHATSGTSRSVLLQMSGLVQDTQAPSVPGNLSYANLTYESVDIQWDPSTDDTGVAGYKVFVDGVYLATTANTSYAISGLADNTEYDFQVSAFDAAGNESAPSPALTVTTLNLPPPVNVPPTASFQADKTSGVAPVTVNFDASASVDSDGTITAYSWDFGDGNTASGVTASHTFNAIGNYLVVLTVTDDSAATSNTSVSISATDKLTQSITFDPLPNKLTTDAPFGLSATASSGLPVSFSLVSGPATLSGNTLTLSGVAGTVTVEASQGGDATYHPATTVSQSFDVLEPGTSLTLTAQISAGSDDVEERLITGKMDVFSSDLELGYEGVYAQLTAMRFTNINIPQGSTILNAYVQFMVDEVETATANLNIRGEASDNPPTYPSSKFSVTNRPQTTANVPWTPVAWTVVGEEGPDQQTPDISAVVQEIVNRPGWAAGNALVILVDGTGTRTAVALDGVPASGAPRLFVEYQPLGGSSARKAAVQTLSSHQQMVLYPNPFEQEFFLQSDIEDAKWMNVMIINAMGQVVHQQKQIPMSKAARIQADLAPGFYSVIITTDNGQVRTFSAIRR
ncbi:MAG: PKD domain-containing protein [Bacteroidia bacterium]